MYDDDPANKQSVVFSKNNERSRYVTLRGGPSTSTEYKSLSKHNKLEPLDLMTHKQATVIVSNEPNWVELRLQMKY